MLMGLAGAQDETKANESEVDKRIDASARVLEDIMKVPDKAIPDTVMKDAKCEPTRSSQPFLAAVRRYSEEVQERTSQNESNTGLSASK